MPNSNDVDNSKIDSKPEEVAPAKATSEKKRRANQENVASRKGPKSLVARVTAAGTAFSMVFSLKT